MFRISSLGFKISLALVLAVLLLREERPTSEVALAVPDHVTFTGLLARVTATLISLGIGAYVVREDGSVDEPISPRQR